jgi:hypothetical protein
LTTPPWIAKPFGVYLTEYAGTSGYRGGGEYAELSEY